MIEKLPFEITQGEYEGEKFDIKNHTSPFDMQVKINELVDAVNAIQKEREAERFEIQEWIGILEAVRKSVNVHEKQIDELQMKLEPEKCETPVDPFAEQRQWIGCLCRFRHGLGVAPTYGILGTISPDSDFPYYKKDTDTYWKYCEPVKPDDDIIYKGGKDE